MKAVQRWPVIVIVGAFCYVAGLPTGHDVASAQADKAVFVTRMFTGPDNLTHTEEVEAKFAMNGSRDVAQLMKITGAELHRGKPGTGQDCHTAPLRHYLITLIGDG